MASFFGTPYLDERAKKHIRQVNRALKRETALPELYLITFATNSIDQLNIIHSCYLLQKGVRNRIPEIVGAAFGYRSALKVFTEMAEETYRETGTGDIRGYLMEKNREGG